jgi:hypothetical protein
LHNDFTAAIQRNVRQTLALGVASTSAVGLLILARGHLPDSAAIAALDRVAYGVFWSLYVWCWCLNVLYLGTRWLTKDTPVVRYGNESALPVYILSEPVIIVLGSAIVAWPLPLWPRFLLLTGFSFAVILAIYEFGVRRWRVTRFLFGLRPLPRHRESPGEQATPSGWG